MKLNRISKFLFGIGRRQVVCVPARELVPAPKSKSVCVIVAETQPAPQLARVTVSVDIQNVDAPLVLEEQISKAEVAPCDQVQVPVLDNKQDEIFADLRSQIDALEARNASLQEEVKMAYSVAADEEKNVRDLLVENQQLKDDNASLVSTFNEVVSPVVLSNGLFPALAEVGAWAEHYYPERLLMTPRALREAADVRHAIYTDHELVYKSLSLLGQQNWDKSFFYGDDDWNGKYLHKLAELGLEDRFSIKAANAGQYGDTYYARVGTTKYFLGQHLTRGTSRDPKRSMRIYFTHDYDEMKVVVGSLPRHLKNSKT